MRDFTIQMYEYLVKEIMNKGYKFVTMSEFIEGELWNSEGRICVLRHDIDKKIENAVKMAKLEREYGIRSTYYVRYVDKVYNVASLKKIESYGHEIGFHYETLDKARGDVDKAYEIFKKELSELRKNFDIKTICMHGYPLNPWRNLDIWKKYSYRELGIIGEAYLDVDYTKVAYFTDTGRSWGSKSRVKDLIPEGNYNEKRGLYAKSTWDLVNIIDRIVPEKIIILAHPNRWAHSFGEWVWEYVSQKTKNTGKALLKRIR